MLVLTRHKDESVQIGETINVAVLDIRGDKVRLGVTAPKDVRVLRDELYAEIKKENEAAANMQPGDLSAVVPQAKPIALAVLVSGGGTTLQNILDCIKSRALNASVNLVIGSRPGLLGVERAASAGIPNLVIERGNFGDISSFSRTVFEKIEQANVELVCLGGWLSLLEIPDRWAGRVMNIHPALLPAFGGRGMYGAKVHEAVIAHGCRVSGCTVHFVDQSYDTGPIILQRTCEVKPDDTPRSLAARVFEEECKAYPDAIRLFQQGKLRIDGNRVSIVANQRNAG